MMSLTPDQSRKVGLGLMPSPIPFLTPRPERRRHESKGHDWNSARQEKDKEVNVQVVLRCRPLSDEEQRTNVSKVIACNEHKREVTVLHSISNKQVDRVFTFDKVFGPKAQQRSIYDQAIAPIVEEVLEGFNCTVFAYGQTGTGKTFTMEGGKRNKGGDLPAEAGVIPRAVRQIFDTLEAQNADYSIKVTFLELYNEEITDLLAQEDPSRNLEDRQKKPISLMEDGKGCVFVRGLEEEAVYSANEIYTLLERGAARRRTADTLLNKRSSRSHSVFSITIHVKEAAVGEEELIKCGKLNLVDLAGSENISRSGAREGRAREAGEINKSLLTLGRVINALVEHSPHIPYRDSKLTRLLRDSLGGRTKTCIVATISPSAHALEETLSTLDYAYRAKSIKNKPEANQRVSKAVLLKDLYLEIERLKEDVRAAREKNGVYVPHEKFAQEEAEKKLRIEKIEQLENELSLRENQADRYNELYLTEKEKKIDVERELMDFKMMLEKSNNKRLDLEENLRVAISTLKEKEIIISKLLSSEHSLIEHAKELCIGLQTASEDITSLFSRLDQKDMMEVENRNMVLTFGSHLDQSLIDLHKTILGSVSEQRQHLRCMEEHVESFLASKTDATEVLETRIKKMTETHASGVVALNELANTMQNKASSDLQQINTIISSQMRTVEQFLATMLYEAKEVIEEIHSSLADQKQLLALSTQQQEKGLQCSFASAQAVSKASVDFYNDLHLRASEIMAFLEESQIKQSDQLSNFETIFKEKAAREEKEALENIAVILASLTSKKTAMVSEVSSDIHDTRVRENKILQRELSNMQNASSNAKEGLSKYLEKLERHFMEDTFSVAESKAVMENLLQECSEKANNSKKQWENAHSYLNNSKESTVLEIESAVRDRVNKNHVAHQEFLSASSAMKADFDARIGDVMAAVDASMMRDQETKKEIDSITSLCLGQLKSTQENHGDRISNIRSKAEKCLTKDYLVDQNSGTAPKRRVIAAIPSLASIEERRTVVALASPKEHGNLEKRAKWSPAESKIPKHHAASFNRAPFTDVN
ncbi:PREDICTED: 125 kDa kinesin-related protein [Populus euphratica]|uniref:125 kDa kinesin-related protein n=1 Tax=Populus euphratica TaxID=75702 RepID=A0AAJ6TYX0_POPEU|nr:PREDICTED: 125 kDa kinesin-related protein [Populus euphratica]